MHRESHLPTIDPSLLDLKAHRTSSDYIPITPYAVDDVAIATGQAGYDEVNDQQLWTIPNNASCFVDDFELAANRKLSSTQLRSAPARAYNIKAPGSATFLKRIDPSLERDGELWNCLQTSAPGASSAPGLNYTSSQCLQNGSPLSPTVLDSPSITFTPAWKSQNYRQGSPFQQRMLEESSHTHDALNNNSSKGLPHSHQQTSEMRPYNSFERAHDVEEKIHKDETWDTWSFPLPIQEDEQTAESLTSSTTAPIPVPGRHRSGNPPSSNAAHGIGNDFPSYSELTGYSINRESWPKRQIEDQDILTAGKSSESQQPIPTELLGHLYGSTNSRHEEFGQSSWDFDQDPFSSPPYTAIGEAALHHCNNDSVSQEIPTTIRIPRSSQRYQPDQASSFPPTAGHYPKFMHAEQRTKKHRSTISTPRPVPPISSGISVPMRRESSRNKSTRGSRSGSLKAIPEDDHVSLCRSPAGSTRGRRNGRLKLATALAASEKRTTGTVCIRCKVLKQTCKGDLPCQGCEKNSDPRSWGQPCQQARFVDIVEAGPCNAVIQRSASIRSIDCTRQVTLVYSGEFNFEPLMERLNSRQSQFNVGVRHFSGSCYILSLAKFVGVMSKFSKASKSGFYNLDDFVKHKLSKNSEWLGCVISHDPSVDTMGRSIEWNNMPSRNTYSYLPLNGSPVRQLDVDNEHDKKDILLAVDLCRIIVRALEISAFRDLQKRINDLPKNRFSEEDLHALFQHLSKLLFSLRGRLSWWAVVGISSSIYDDSRDEHIERVTELTKTLYFWYFVVKKKLPPWRGPTSKGVYNHYADTLGLVFDGFPEDESLGGFHAWMDHGRSLFSQASVHQPLPQPFPLYR